MISNKPGPAAAGEKDLLAALKRREPWAWDRLQSRRLDSVFPYLLLHCPRREDAEDGVFVAVPYKRTLAIGLDDEKPSASMLEPSEVARAVSHRSR